MTITLTSAAQDVRSLSAEAVERALVSAGRVGMSLSGGIDSSTIYMLSGQSIPCFTGYYEGDAYDERFFARMVAGYEHHEIQIVPRDFVEHFDNMVVAARPPFQGPGTFGQYMVAKYASDHVDVMLSGEGGDELFGGYARLMMVAGERVPDGYEDYQLPDGYPDTVEEALAWDFDRLSDLLAVDEQMLGAFDIEARSPFTDDEVISYVLNLPANMRVGKRLLKEGMEGLVPHAILARTDKRGFPTPFVEWANTDSEMAAFVHDRIGYLPDPGKPWDRGWWLDLITASRTFD